MKMRRLKQNFNYSKRCVDTMPDTFKDLHTTPAT